MVFEGISGQQKKIVVKKYCGQLMRADNHPVGNPKRKV
jgi:hypothetical protein